MAVAVVMVCGPLVLSAGLRAGSHAVRVGIAGAVQMTKWHRMLPTVNERFFPRKTVRFEGSSVSGTEIALEA